MQTNVRVTRLSWEAEDIVGLELTALSDTLSSYEPGAHIDVELPNGLIRQYSLLKPYAANGAYEIAVYLDPASRGGASYIHRELRVGQNLRISLPRNHFPLNEAAQGYLFIGGGIGITPLLCMMRRLATLGKKFAVCYATRSPHRAAFINEIRRLTPHALIHHDSEYQGQPLDLQAIISATAPETEFYCCGPSGMMAAFQQATSALPQDRLHTEYFTPSQDNSSADRMNDGAFDVVLARSAKTLRISPTQSVLDAVLASGIAVPYSCCNGVCGSCEVKVVEGNVDHRDSVLLPSEKLRSRSMMICVSRAVSDCLVLDL